MALRALALQATWNYERQQGVGWAWAFSPALRRLHPDHATRCRRLAEETAYFNTQPTLASLALGAAAALEERQVAAGTPDDGLLARVKAAMGASLAALGDRLFWFTLRPVAACAGVLFALAAGAMGAVVMLMAYNGLHLGLRLNGVSWGYRRGPAVMDAAVRGRFERLTRGLAIAGAGLVGVLVAWLLAPGGVPAPLVFQAALGAGLALGLMTATRARPSPTEWALGLGALCVFAAGFR